MKQFVVPQFIDIEDKIFGPITSRQFIILMIGGFLVFAEFKLFDFALFLLLGIITAGLSIIFSFVKVNGMPVHYFLLNLFQGIKQPKERIWRKEINEEDLKKAVRRPVVMPAKVSLSSKQPFNKSRLQELVLMVDTGGAYNPEEDINQ
ncbi:PrgI family protein [Patescibacteria group bacterium]|nr:PrgI family protein [Patescibacteria group bacterium]